MQTTRISNRLPQVYRVINKATSTTTTPTRTMSLFPRIVNNELNSFGPMFRLLDEYANHALTTSGREGSSTLAGSLTRFSPKFDVKETSNNYELHGELPGIEQKDVEIEFTDSQTLIIKGQTEQVREQGQRPGGLIEGQAEQGKITGAGEEATQSHKATVEDENAAQDPEVSTPAESVSEVAQQQQPSASQSKYWVREMSRGSFSRTFTFPSRVDHDAVKASLKNGILSVVVPKSAAPQARRINIE